jgi:predicted Zn-dependent peptidase
MLDRKSAPQFAEIKDFHLPSPEILELTNRTPIVLFQDVQQQVLKIELVFKAGKWFEPKLGVAHFTAQMLEKGTANKTSYQIAQTFDKFGCSIEVSAGFDFTSISLYFLSKNINKVLPLFCEIVTSPSFPESEFQLMKDVFRQNLKINNKKNSYVAGKAVRQNIFGEQHPYGGSIEADDVDKIIREDLLSFFNNYFALHEVYVTGYLSPSIKQSLISELSGIKSTTPIQITKAVPIITGAFSQHIEISGSVQASLRLGKKTINRSHPDYAALVLLNHILGGYFGSRLMKNIREEKGLTYGIHSSLNTLKNDALFLIGTDVNRETQDIAFAEIKSEINKLIEEPVERTELEITKNHLLGSLQLETANPFSILEKIKAIRLNQLNPNFYSKLFTDILTTDAATLKRVAQSHLQTVSLFEVSAG